MKWTIRALFALGFVLCGIAAFIRPNSDNAFPKGGMPRDQTRVRAVEAGESRSSATGEDQSPASFEEHAPSLFHLPHFKTEPKEQHGDLTT